jgi:rSAM/selenodomain-associated transferase 2
MAQSRLYPSPPHVQPHPPAGSRDAVLPLSVIIPTLNAAAHLASTLAAIPGTAEIIVVDGGSEDDTRRAAAAAGARVIAAERGRGTQLAAGIAAATQPWLLLLHADTRPSEGWQPAVAQHLAGGVDRAGFFRFTLDSPTSAARRLERLVAWRCRVLALPYGDQGLLIHRDLLRSVGGMRPIPLMEDVDLVRRLGHRRLVALPADVVTSAARYEREGYLLRSARNLLCLSLWFLGVAPRLIKRIYA